MIQILVPLVITAIIASAIMTYVSLATSIGPWVGPLLVLIAQPLLRIFFIKPTGFNEIAIVIGGSIGGILATACAFSFPAIYFIDSALYNEWLLSPFFFIGTVSTICFLSGAFGMLCADRYQAQLGLVEKESFPSAQLIFGMIHAADKIAQRVKLFCGALLYAGFLCIQSVLLVVLKATRFYFFVNSATIIPMLVSIGFVTGHVIALPLCIGVIIRFACVDAIRTYWYSSSVPLHFAFAFCTGIIMSGILISFFKLIQSFFAKNTKQTACNVFDGLKRIKMSNWQFYGIVLGGLLSVCAAYYSTVSIFFIVYAIVATIISVYFMVILAAQTGLAYLGRFATLVMVPAMIIFQCSWLQLIILATCVEIAGGVAVDVLSGRKIVKLAGLDGNRFIIIQFIGLVIASIATGFVLWVLCSYLQLGSCELAGYKAQARALLLGIEGFDFAPLGLGFFVGTVCSLFHINTSTLLGGILMPLETAMGLIIGGAIAFFVKNKDLWYPLASGVFAANSLYMIVKAIFYH